VSLIAAGGAHRGSVRGFYPKTIEGSLRFNDGDTPYLSWTPASAGDRKTWTFSFWIKRTTIGQIQSILEVTNGSGISYLGFFNDTLRFLWNGGGANASDTTMVFRDPSAWYHIVVVWDTVTGGQGYKVYVNGESVTVSISSPTTDTQTAINDTPTHHISTFSGGGSYPIDGYLAEVFFIDGTAHDADAFGETKNGVWVPKNITATDFTMGTNGFHLTFQDDTEVEAFNTVLYRGNGGTQSITGMGFKPDFLWIKNRNGTQVHQLFDVVRGVEGSLRSNGTDAENIDSPNDRLLSFDSDGFSLGDDGNPNGSGNTYVAWGWDAGANNAVTGHSSVTWEGNSGNQKISGLPFSPDLVWIKNRDATNSHGLYDTVRGATNFLSSDSTGAEATSSTTLTSFDKNGFNLGSSNQVNGAYSYVGWAWDAGDGDPVSNTDGSITSTVKASPTNGFSIVSYTGNGTAGATIGHGLSSAPDMMIVRRRTVASGWMVYHSANTANPETEYLSLQATDATTDDNTRWNDTAPTSSVFSVGTAGATNASGSTYIAYCFHDVTGKQKFGTYDGDGTTDGSLEINVGFRPGWLMIKRTDSAHDWSIIDASRSPFNPTTKELLANTSDAEGTAQRVNFTDTGFQLVNNGGRVNANGGTYIYAAFAGSYSDYITDYNTDGDVDTRVKANDTTGFSIVSYKCKATTVKGDTIGHGLSSAPDFMIFKGRNNATGRNWGVYHTSIGNTGGVLLNSSGVTITSDEWWNNTSPTNSVVTLGNYSYVQENGYDYIAYCWAEKSGYSKFGINTTSRVSCGFKPALVILKDTAVSGSWYLLDNTRDADGDFNHQLYAQLSNSEDAPSTSTLTIDDGTAYGNDGGGFTVTWTAQTDRYGSGVIYAAFADTRDAAFWLDQSGNDNDWQPVNLDHNDTVSDSPTDNHATFSPLVLAKSGTTNFRTLGVFSDGNLTCTTNADNESGTIPFGATSGQYYVEFNIDNLAQRLQIIVYTDELYVHQNAITTSSDGGGNATDRVSWTTGDVIGIAIDMDNNKVFFHKNGDYFGTSNPSTNTGGDTLNSFTGLGFRQDSGSTGNAQISFNAGQQPFKYDPPA